MAVYEVGSGLFPDAGRASTRTSFFPDSSTVRHTLPLFVRHPVQGAFCRSLSSLQWDSCSPALCQSPLCTFPHPWIYCPHMTSKKSVIVRSFRPRKWANATDQAPTPRELFVKYLLAYCWLNPPSKPSTNPETWSLQKAEWINLWTRDLDNELIDKWWDQNSFNLSNLFVIIFIWIIKDITLYLPIRIITRWYRWESIEMHKSHYKHKSSGVQRFFFSSILA